MAVAFSRPLSAVSGRVSAEKIKKSGRKNFCLCRVGKGQALLQTLVGALACSGLQMCLWLCVGLCTNFYCIGNASPNIKSLSWFLILPSAFRELNICSGSLIGSSAESNVP